MKIVVLIKKAGSKETTELVFDRLPVLIGRSKICDLSLEDPLASRQHCVLEPEGDSKIKLVDLQSANGTLLNGKKTDKGSFGVGDVIKIGSHEIHLEKVTRTSKEESTVHDLEPILIEDVPEGTGTIIKTDDGPVFMAEPIVEREPQKAKEDRPVVRELKKKEKSKSTDEVTLKTPTILKPAKTLKGFQTKDWVQVSLFWKSELINIRCFDRGEIVTIGKAADNDFVIDFPSVPATLQFLKIQATGVEINLSLAVAGVVETRNKTVDLAEIRKSARQTDLGLAGFIPFQDRCLIEIGPFSIFIQSVRLRIVEPLESPLIRDKIFSGILASVFIFFLLFMMTIGGLEATKEEEVAKEIMPPVQLEMPVTPPDVKPPPPPPPPPKVEKKIGPTPQKAVKSGGTEGAGAKASGPEGKRGREQGKTRASGREIGFQTKQPAPTRATPKGAFGKEDDPNKARAGKRPDEGTGTGKPKPKGTGQQAGSIDKPKPQVKLEDQGLLGVLGGSGGGGSASSGGSMKGSGLGGRIQGAIEGLERGGDTDGRGSGGRGNSGREFGGGGSSLEVGGLATAGKGGGRSGFGLGSSGKKGEADVSFIAEEIEVIDGLTKEEIRRVVQSNMSQIRACYERSLISSGNQDISGRLEIGWFVNSEGRVESVSKKSAFGSEAGLYDCIAGKIRTWQFPRPRGGKGAQVGSYPFVLRRGG